jgi:hypothetical protein
MKKISAAIILMLVLAASTGISQNLYIGAGGTWMSTWVTNQNNYGYSEMDYKTTFGLAGNFNLGYEFNKHIGLKMEIGYAKLGQSYKDQIADSVYSRIVKLNYLQIPLLFKYRTGGEVARFYLLVGPQFNFLLSANQTYLMNGDADDRTFQDLKNNTHKVSEENIKDRYTSYDIFARIDFGVDITLVKNLILNAGLSMGYGLTDINATDYRIKDTSGNYNPSHNIFGGFNVGLCYSFDFSK